MKEMRDRYSSAYAEVGLALTPAVSYMHTLCEISAEIDIDLAADLVLGPISVAVFFRGGRPTTDMVEPIVDLALYGILKRD